MPGTIMVSVLELMDLPLSSSTSIRASMGKIEYQISDKGNFSFPLTSLRDDLIFKIHDSQENEISSAGIHIRLILEKGVWEDMFPIGGGKLHLKLQVILSDEERERIRMMRQSALKKKHDELHSSNQRGVEGDSGMIIGNAKLPFSTSDEVSESPKQHLQHEEAKLRNVALESLADDKESGTRNVVGSQLEQKLLNSNIADQIKKTSSTKPMSQPLNLIQLQHREDDGLQYSEKKAPPKRTPSNVKKMITAFESGLPKDMRSHIKPPPTKYQVSPIEKEDSSEAQHLEQDKSLNKEPSGFLQERVKSASLVTKEESIGQIKLLNYAQPKNTMQLELSTTNTLNKQTDSNARNKDQVEETNNNEAYSKHHMMTTSIFETVTVSGKMPLKEEKRRGKAPEVSYETCTERDLDNKYYSFESSEAWIFPHESRRICVTTSGKSVMDILENEDTKHLSQQRSFDFPKVENKEKNATYIGTGTEGSKYEKVQDILESKTTTASNNNGDENSGGPFDQVIKAAIIIGFGLLVLLTRQRKKRKEKNA
ncbi:uncharacterized protein [Cicer arietinum]|uniref:Uncharacterized protein LOC101498984 isoform X2 n=1 Tax=Cicer arietinum TaxID=3827 RepID=A0A1S3EFN8_CICAR|nr:uncharacterized protein LOC101498984 isoform X2 [Cicer arietinum]